MSEHIRYTTERAHLEHTPDSERVSLLLPIQEAFIVDDQIRETLETSGYTLKPEFHVTLVDVKPGTAAAELIGADSDKLLELLEKSTQLQSWRVTLTDEYRHVEKWYPGESEPRKSIIRLVDCPDLHRLYDQINILVGSTGTIETPPAHVTLATSGSPKGIGLMTSADLERYSSPLL